MSAKAERRARKRVNRDAGVTELLRRAEANAAVDAMLARCETCGLEQVQCPACIPRDALPWLRPCVLCGGEIGVA